MVEFGQHGRYSALSLTHGWYNYRGRSWEVEGGSGEEVNVTNLLVIACSNN